jgi:hypothetical protein
VQWALSVLPVFTSYIERHDRVSSTPARIWEILGSSFSLKTGYSDGFMVFFSPLVKFWGSEIN